MKYRTFKNNIRVSEICLGGLHFGTYQNQSETKRLIDTAVERGINFIETAPMYGNGLSESLIGKAIADKKDKVIISTKVGLIPSIIDQNFSVIPMKMERDNIIASIDKSLRALGVDCIDLLQLHAFDSETSIFDICNTLKDLIKAGKVGSIGVSNHNYKEYLIVKSAMDEFELPLISFQCHFNMIERRAAEKLIPLCGQHQVGVLCNRGLARGLLGGQYKSVLSIPNGSRASKSKRIKALLDQKILDLISDLKKLSDKYNMTIAQLSLLWILGKREVVSIALGMQKIAQIDEMVSCLEIPFNPMLFSSVDEVVMKHNLLSQINSKPEEFFEK